MQWTLPGTVLTFPRQDADRIEELFSSMFLAGDMTLSQIVSITGLENYTVQNWVKRGFLSPPAQKRYSKSQLCRILTINMLKAALPMEDICGLLEYINGDPGRSDDDLIDDSQLYFLFVRLAACPERIAAPESRDAFLNELLQTYREPVPGGRERVMQVLRAMLLAWAAAQLRLQAQEQILRLKEEGL